jgi:hypothetical protein
MSRQTLGHTLAPIRDRSIAASSKTYRYSTNLQVVIDANSHLVVAIGVPLPSSRNECRASTESGVDRACRGHRPSPTAATRTRACSSRTSNEEARRTSARNRKRRKPPPPGVMVFVLMLAATLEPFRNVTGSFGRQAVVAVLSAQRFSVTPTKSATAAMNSAGCSRCP